MYKLIASDMDETFLSSDHSLVKANIDTIKTLKEKGVWFVPSSGRPYWSIMETFEPIKDIIKDTYIVSFNGGCINKVGVDEPIYANQLSFEHVEYLFKLGKKMGVGMHIYELNGPCWGCDFIESEHAYLKGHMPVSMFNDDNIDFLKDRPIAKMLFVKPDLEWLEKAAEEIDKTIEWGDTTISANRYLEINPKDVNKGTGLVKLAEILGIDIADTIALGDSANDNEMIEMAGLGIAVANATDKTKSIADVVATSTNDDGILAEVLDKYID